MSVTYPTWRIQYLDWDANPIGEIQDAVDRKFSFLLDRPSTVEFKLDVTNDLIGSILAAEGGIVLLYRGSTLMMTAEAYGEGALRLHGDHDERNLTCIFTETMWPRLQQTLVGKSTAGYKATNTDKGLVVHNALTTANAGFTTTISVGSRTASSNVSVGPYYYKPLMEMITDLALTTSGFDFWQTPAVPTPTANNAYTTGSLNIAPSRGAVRSEAIFEYGAGTKANVREYDYIIGPRILNSAYCLPADWPNNSALSIASAGDLGSIVVYGLREEVVPTDLVTVTSRTEMAGTHVAVRAAPRKLFMFNPLQDDGSGRVPTFPADYDVGDVVEGRVNDHGQVLLDDQVRVYGVRVEPDRNGMETVTLELALDSL